MNNPTKLVSLLTRIFTALGLATFAACSATNGQLKKVLPDAKPLVVNVPRISGEILVQTGTTLKCTVVYDQKYLRPRFSFFNKHFPNAPRAVVLGKQGETTGKYILMKVSESNPKPENSDVHKDEMYCTVEFVDGNRSSVSEPSSVIVVDDTLPVLLCDSCSLRTKRHGRG